MTDPSPPKPALPPHPMSRSARRMLLLGAAYLTLGLGVAVLLGGASIMAAGFAFGGAVFIAAGIRMQRIGPAVMINNAAHDLLTQGRYDETLALLYRHLRNEALGSAGKAPRQSLVNAARAEIVRETMELLDGATSFNVGMQLQNMLVRLREVRP